MTPLPHEVTTHIFDVDHTLTAHSSGRRFAEAGVRSRLFSRRAMLSLPWFYLRYRIGQLSLSDITREISVLTGCMHAELEALADRAWNEAIRADLYPAAREYLTEMQRGGHRLVLASTSFDIILLPLARELGISDIIASHLEFEHERATGWLTGGPCYAEEKARRISVFLAENNITPATCAMYSDSFHDIPSLELVGYPVAVHPDAVLKRRARRSGWPILSFRP